MKKFRTGIAAVILAGVLGVMPIWAAYGPGVTVTGGPGYSTPDSVGNVYLYPGVKGNGPVLLDMISSFLDDDDDEDDDSYHYEQGWHYSPNGWWYLKENGEWPNDGWQCIDSRWYYFTEGGHVKTGWLNDGGNWFYLNPVDDGSFGAMRTGWQIVDGKAYYFNGSSDGVYGAMLVNATTPDGYQVGADGAMILR